MNDRQHKDEGREKFGKHKRDYKEFHQSKKRDFDPCSDFPVFNQGNVRSPSQFLEEIDD
jgi:hypothetical protein